MIHIRLAGKAQDVELGDVGHGHGMDVAVRGLAEVGGVGLPAELVPVAGEDAARTRPLEGDAEPANAAEEVDEAERRALLGLGCVLPSDARRSGAVGRWIFVKCSSRGDEALILPPRRSLSLLTSAATRRGFPAHASTPLQSSEVESPSALASRATFLMPGFLSPRSMPEM